MTNNPFNIDLNEAFATVVQRREQEATEAKKAYIQEVNNLVGEIAFKVNEVLNNDEDDVCPALQAILDGAGETKTVEVEKVVEKTVPDQVLVQKFDDLEKKFASLESDNKKLSTENGRLKKQLEETKAALAAANRMQKPKPTKTPLTAKVKGGIKKLSANAQS